VTSGQLLIWWCFKLYPALWHAGIIHFLLEARWTRTKTFRADPNFDGSPALSPMIVSFASHRARDATNNQRPSFEGLAEV